MGDLARESILQALVAAFVLAALARAWRVEDPGVRVRLGLVAIACPALLAPLLHAFAPGRGTDAFRDGVALFDSARWNDIRLAGVGLGDVLTALAAAAGLILLLRDVVPWIRDRMREEAAGPADGTACREARTAFERIAGAMHLSARPLAVLDEEGAVLQCTGARRPVVVISRGACARLDAAELDAALAHEAAHLEYRDTALGWVLMTVRAILWFNPVVQVLARAVTEAM